MIPNSIASLYLDAKEVYPDTTMTAEERDRAFYLKVARSFMCDFVNNRTMRPFNFSGGRSYSELRAYAQGEQSIEKYKDYLCPPQPVKRNTSGVPGPQKEVRTAYMNISWDTVKVMPKIIDTISGLASGIKFKPSIIAIDDSSITTKEMEKALYKLQMDPMFQQIKNMAQGMGIQMPSPEMSFENASDVDLFFSLGGYKLAYEIAAGTAMLSTERQSDLDVIKKQFIEDLATLGKAVICDYIEPIDNAVKIRYVDPDNFTCNYSNLQDYRNIERAFEVRYMTISEMRRETDLTEEELIDIAKKYQKYYMNSQVGDYGYTRQRDKTVAPLAFQEDIPVVYIKFIASDIERYAKVTSKRYGNLSYKPTSSSKLSKQDKSDGKYIDEKKVEYVYKVAWIPGTECVFDYGKDYDIVREGSDGNKKAILPYHVFKTQSASIVERCIAFVDDICLAVYKKRNVIARMPPIPALAVNAAAMRNITLGGKKMTPLESDDLFNQAGRLYYEDKDDHGRYAGGPTSTPIMSLSLGTEFANAMQAFNMEIDKGMENIRLVSGVNEFIDGTKSPADLLVGVAELAVSATNNTLRPLFYGYQSAIKRCMQSCLLKWQLVAATDGYKGKVRSIGQHNVDVFNLDKNFAAADFGLTVEVLPTETDKQATMQRLAVQEQIYIQSSGQAGLSPDVVFAIERLIKADNIMMAQLMLSKAVKEQRERAEKKQMEMMEANAKAQERAVQLGNEGKMAVEKEANKGGAEQAMISAESKIEAEKIKGENAAIQQQQMPTV